MSMPRLLSAIVLLAAMAGAMAAPPKVRVTGVYSDLAYVEEAGDLVGTEIFIGYQGDNKYFALVQCAEGSPSKPQLVEVKVEGMRIQFTLPASESSHCPAATFTGVIGRAGLKGRYEGGGEAFTLRRKTSYWQ